MDETWARLAIVAGALFVAAVATMVLRIRSSAKPKELSASSLSPGVYFFSSATCLDCASARKALVAHLGEGGYAEILWEDRPGLFHEIGVTAVPATLVVDANGSAELFPGQPAQALRRLSP